MAFIKLLFVIIFLLLAVIGDLKNYTVNNKLIMVGLIGSLFFQLIPFSIEKMCQWGVGAFAPIGILFVLFLWKVLGAGDIKVFSVVGSIFGVNFIIRVIIAAFIIGAVLSVIQMIQSNNLVVRLQYLADFFQETIQNKKIKPYYKMERDGCSCVIHFTIAIFGAFLLCYLFPDLGQVTRK